MKQIYHDFLKYSSKFLYKYTIRFLDKTVDQFSIKSFLKWYIKSFPVTIFLVLMMTILHLLTYIVGDGATNNETARQFGAMLSTNKSVTEYPYFLSAIYQHIGGMKHYAANMTSLLIFAPLIEKIFGAVKFTLLFNLTGIFGCLTTLYLTTNNISSGASGGISGILGVYIALILKRNPAMNWFWKIIIGIYFIAWIHQNFFSDQDVSVTGHVGGMISGLILGLLIPASKKLIGKPRYVESILKYAAVTAFLWCLLFTLRYTGDKTKAFAENPFGIYDGDIHLSLIEEVSLNYNVNFLMKKYAHLLNNYNELVYVLKDEKTMDKNDLEKMHEKIKQDIKLIESKKMNKEIKKEKESIIEFLKEFLSLNEQIISYIENKDDMVLKLKTSIAFNEFYIKILEFDEEIEPLLEKAGLKSKGGKFDN